MKKTILGTAVAAVLGVASVGAQAAAVTTWQLEDYNSDGLSSDFNFFSPPAGNGPNAFAAGAGDGAPIAMNTGEIGTNVFTTGFNFGGAGVFAPFVANSSGTGNIAADITGGTLTFSALDFGGLYQGVNFYLPPDGGVVNIEDLTDLGSGSYGVVARYVATINDPSSSFNGFQANWRLEGVMSTSVSAVPVPAAAWLFGSAVLGMVGVGRRRKKAMIEA